MRLQRVLALPPLHTTILRTLFFSFFSKAAKALPPVREINEKLKNAVSSQGRSKNTFIKLNEEIKGIKTQISQVSCFKSFNLFATHILEKDSSSQIFLNVYVKINKTRMCLRYNFSTTTYKGLLLFISCHSPPSLPSLLLF